MWVNYKPIDAEIDDDKTRIFHVFEMWIGLDRKSVCYQLSLCQY